jgi:lambda repressor-like predicted transcriptional regulator
MKYWLFLIAANEHWDNRVVLCPDFIDQAGRRPVLRNCFDPSTALAEGIGSRNVTDEKLGSISLFFRAVRVKEGSRDAYDAAGRPLVRISGIAIRQYATQERLDPNAAQRVLDRALPQLDNIFAQIRATEVPPKAVLSRLQSDVRADDHDLGPDVGPATPTGPSWQGGDVGKQDNLSPRKAMYRRTPLEGALLGAALALVLTAGGVGWIYIDSRAENKALKSELAALTKLVNGLIADVSLLQKKLDNAR